MQAVLLGAVVETNWSKQGVLAKSFVEQWSFDDGLEGTLDGATKVASSLASDGQYLYIHGSFGLVKVGSGYGNSKKVWNIVC